MIASVEFLQDLPIPQKGFPTSRSFHAADGWTFEVGANGIRLVHVEKGLSYVIHGVGAVIHEEPEPAPAPTPQATSEAATPPAKKKGQKKS